MASSAATASLFPAPFAPLWKASSTGSPNERFTFANLREKRSSHRNIRTIVCAGERKKSLSQKLKEKKTANSGDVTSEIEQTEEDIENVEVTEKTRSEDIVKTMPSMSKAEDEASTNSSKDVKQREVDYALAKQKIEEEVKKYSSEKQNEKLTEGLKLTEDLEATQRREQEFELMMKEEAKKRKKKVEEELAAARQREIELKEKMEKRKKLEQEARLAIARERERVAKEEAKKREITRLAELNTSRLSKMFYYPQKVEASAQVEIFFNKGITVLAEQEAVHILYSFNGWRWQSFTSKLEKNDVAGGDWWSCKIDVPREAYKIDFVFFNGENVYENNESNDFHLFVEGGMDEQEFEAFLSLEKRKEAEKIALEQAERDRAAEEARKRAETLASEEADKAEVKKIVSEQRECAHKLMQKAANSIPGVWDIEPASFRGGQTVKLFYNRGLRPLKDSLELWIHGGYNNWKEAVSITRKLSKEDSRPGDWWSVEVYVPKSAFMLNWVFADGPPEKATIYDNNNYQDFHTAVPAPILEDLYWADVEEKVYSDLRKERKTREEEARKKAELKAKMKEEMKQKARREFLQSQSHIYYTDPMEVRAGKRVSLLYNPLNTVLNGKPEIWLRHSFNRWTHWLNPFPPIKMVGAPNSSHLKATLEVPKDAYMMDFVFSERGDELGGVYDNRNGFDYHIPVMGSTTKEPPMSIVHISVEMAPIAKVGGLGDVVTSLSRAVQELGHNVEVILPKYDCLKYHHVQDLQEKESFEWGGTRIRVWNGKVEGLNVHFIEPENGLFWVGCIYGRRDDGNRFGFFCGASLEFLLRSGRHPDVIHCHDWSTAPVAWLFQESYKHYGLSNARIVFTIHNMEFGIAQIGKAMANANMATTVSHSYAQEVSGNPAISPHRGKFHGIRNGIDLDIWDPFDDPYIPASYTADQVVEGKGAAKVELQHRLGLQRVDKPLLGIISRLTAQKGIHLIKHAIWRTLDRGGQVVLLGSAPDPRVQNDFVNLSNQLSNSHNDMARLCLTYDEPLSHLIYAGADIILVPSIFEPCGLTQLIAMRYGAIPVVRKTGGLNDTVFDVDHDRERARSQCLESNGFSFEGTDAAGVDYALNRALSAWYETRDWFNSLSKKVMEQDWSWNRPALDYVELYYVAKK